MPRLRVLTILLCLALMFCALGLWRVRSQSGGVRRLTNTTEEGLSLNPSLSGNGRRVAFESTEDIARAGGGDHFRSIRADLNSEPPTFMQLGGTRSPAPGISQDGSRIAFAAKEDPLGTNPDGNSEIFFFDGSALRQVTNTTPADISQRVRDGNFQPSLSDDGRFIAFSSNRNLASANADANLEIFIYDTATQGFTQLTSTTEAVGASDAKISGDGTRVAYIRQTGATPAVQRDLVLQDRAGGAPRVLATNVQALAFTYGRAISDDGTRIVYSAETATNSSQVFLYDGRSNTTRQVTTLAARETDVPLHPTISGDGNRLAFATRRTVIPGNSDNSIELYTYDVLTARFTRVTSAPAEADGFNGSTRVVEVVSSLNDNGSVIAFNFPRLLTETVANTELQNNSEIYVTAIPLTLTVLNGASFGHEPAPVKAVAPNSIAVALGSSLASTTEHSQRQADGTFPRSVGGTTVTVNGRQAQIFYVSPTQVNFLVPAETELGTAEVVVTNAEGFQSRGSVTVLRAAPGVFTYSGDGLGEGVILNADTLQPGPFDPSNGQLRLLIFTTGARNATQVTVTAAGRSLTVETVTPSSNMPGLDEIRVLVPSDLRGAGTVELVVHADGRDSNPVTVIFSGDAHRDVVINEVLADPPDGQAGDANHDGVRSGSDDEFVELVNTSGRDLDISGYQLLTRSTSATSDTVRHTFAAGTIFPAGSAIVVFGGGAFDPADPVFGGAQVLKASTGGLSLINSGGVVTLQSVSHETVDIFSYGGSTGLNGDANQSLTRSPDATGQFAPHSTAPGSGGRLFSPGTRIDGSPFITQSISRIEITPTEATINVGAQQQFTARAYDANGQLLTGVLFQWQSSNPAVATVDQNGLATGVSAGTTQIRASARGVQSGPALLTVRDVERTLTRVEVTPSPATIPVGGSQQFTARGFDQFGNEITGLAFVWESSNTAVATVDQSGLATAIAQGQAIIKATSQGVSGTATLNVTPPTLVINEVLADPPGSATTDTQGDANHDGVRSSSDDEFVELVNATTAGLDISGWTLRTRATGSTTETVRHTFIAGRTVPAGEAIVVFGGGAFDPANPAFRCAQVVKASTGGLSLTNGGLTLVVRDAAGNLVTQFAYGTSTPLNGDANQSLTRSPDITGAFTLHSTAPGSDGRVFSPGTRVNGSPFGNCPARLASVTISPSSASIVTGQSTQFTAQAFDQFGQPLPGATISFASDNTGVATVDSVTTDPSTGIATATVTGRAPGTAHITAQATDGATTVSSSQATLTVTSQAITYSVSGQVKDVGNNPLSGVLITFEMNFEGTLSTRTVVTDANGNYSSGDLGCQNSVKVTPSKTGYTFSPSAISFVSTRCLSGSDTANFTGTPASAGTLVISQIYGGGGNTGATYTHDFVEIFNSGTTTVNFATTPYSIQYTGAAGSFGGATASSLTVINSGTIAPGQYFLVQEFGPTTAAGVALPTPDATGSINLATSGGKVALVIGTAPVSAVACPGDDPATTQPNPANNNIADFVGYGSAASATCYEGQGPAPAHANTTADFRKAGGCLDSNNNAFDFLVGRTTPRNTASPLNNCASGGRPEMTISDVTVTEGNTGTVNATFAVTLSVPASSTVTVDFTTADGTATAGTDYQATSGTLTFAPGDLTKTVTVLVNGDTLDEANETFFVNLTNAVNATLLDNQGQGTITDNDAAPTISINDTSVAEGDAGTTSATFNVTLSAASGQTVTVNYATADGTATAGTDYQAATGTLTFSPGQTTQTVTVLVNGDTTFEPSETFNVNLTGPTNATIADPLGQGTITNDDAPPSTPAVSINDIAVTEGNTGTKTLDFTVSLSTSGTQPITVDYATADGTATAGTDYLAATGMLTFAPGETVKTISVTINGDTTIEPDETFFVNLTNPVNATFTDPQGQGTITNDDTAPPVAGVVVISQIYGGGGNTGAPFNADFIELFNPGTSAVDITTWSVQYASGSSTSGNFSVTPLCPTGTCSIAAGGYFLVKEAGGATGSSFTADVTGTIGMSASSGKVALVTTTTPLSAASGCSTLLAGAVDFVGYGSATCFEGTGPTPAPGNTTAALRKSGGCQDTNDNASDFLVGTPTPRYSGSPRNFCNGVSVSIDNVTVTEGNSGTVAANFTVTLSAASAQTVTVDFTTADGTATAGSDYQSNGGTLTFAPGDLTKTVTVLVNGDTLDEANETFFVNLTNAVNANISASQGTGTITDDDATPSLSINDVTVAEGNAGAGTTNATFTVTLSAQSGQQVTVDFATAAGSATAGTDYQATSGTLTFAPGQTSKTVTVLVNGDTDFENDETFFVNLTNPVNATLTDPQGQATITNDDPAPVIPALSINDATVTEGDVGTVNATFTVTLSSTSTQTVTVNYSTSTTPGTATAEADYLAAAGMLTFAPGETTQTITVTVKGDTLVEPDETFFVTLSSPTNATLLDNQGQGTISNDDFAHLVISQVYGGGGNTGAPYTNDFIEIFNRGTTTVNFATTPYSVQYASAASSFGAANTITVINSGTIAPGQYFLIQEAATNTASCGSAPCGAALPTPDASGNINLATTGGKVALVSGTAPVTAAACPGATTPATTPNSLTIVDFLGYGTANCYEGTAAAPAHANTTADFRKAGGCLDTDQNSTDFFVSAPTPRNTFSPTNDCSGGLRPEITINDRALSESNTSVAFTVTLSTASTLTVTVDFSTANGTAIAGADYTATSGTLTFAPGDTSKTITVTVNNDALDEANETYFVNLSNPSNGTILDGQGLGTINDNDPTPSLSINNASVAEGDSGTKTLDLTVTLSAASGQTVTVNYATADGTATAGTDYVAATGMLTFAPGETVKTISVTINGDTTIEPDETFSVTLSGATNATLPAAPGQGTITNDDVAVDLSITKTDTPDPVNAGENITYTLTVTNNSATAAAQSVTVSDQIPANTTLVSVGTPPTGWTRTDATPPGGTGTITFSRATMPATAPEKTATFTITVNVNSSAANNSSIGNTATVSSTTEDDNPSNNSATTATAVRTPADLALAKSVNNPTPNVGGSVTFTITVSNNGPYAATGVSVKDQLPVGLTYVSDDSGGAYNSTTGIWTIGTINASGSATLHITATVTSGATSGVTNTAEVFTSDQFDPNSTPGNNVPGENDQSSAAVRAQSADLSLSKTVNNPSPSVGESVVFTLTLSNAGPDAATNVQVGDSLPAGLQFVSATASTGSYDAASGVWTVGTVAVGTPATLNITAQVQATGTITNTAEVINSGVFDPDSTPANHAAEDDQSSASVSAGVAQADLSLTKTVNNPTPNVGGSVTFTITVSNAGPQAATGVQVKDQLPAGLTYVSDNASGAYNSTTGIWTVGTINASGSATLHITATVTSAAAGGVSNTAQVNASDQSDPDSTPGNNVTTEDDQSSATVTPLSADLSITKSDSPDPVAPGGTLTYTIVVTNNGPNAAQNVTVTDNLPSEVTFTGCASQSGNGVCAGTGNNRTVTFASIASGASETITLQGTVSGTAADNSTINNTASVGSATTFDPATANNSAAASTTVHLTSADIETTKSDSPDPVLAGNNITYTINVINRGPDAASGLTFTDTVPSNTTFVSLSSPVGWTCSTLPAAGGTGQITCTASTLASAQTNTFTLVVKVDPNVTAGTVISNTAAASSGTNDPAPGNNSDTEQTTVQASARLSVTKTDTPDPVAIGNNITYTITVTNGGPDNASSATLTDAIPANTTFKSFTTAPGWTCTTPAVNGTGTVSCTNPTQNVGQSVFTLVVNVNSTATDGTV
ncbi:MAG TPA: Calx-beta domain-containing protein, partial [Pyrinomonadaceae bacterium]